MLLPIFYLNKATGQEINYNSNSAFHCSPSGESLSSYYKQIIL
jgi:hypothetical protein